MAKQSHTQGEWIARPDPHGGPNDWCIGLNDDFTPFDYVAVCSKRDAPLIATAPLLLEAVIFLANALEDGHWQYTKADLRRLIAKATGEQQ